MHFRHCCQSVASAMQCLLKRPQGTCILLSHSQRNTHPAMGFDLALSHWTNIYLVLGKELCVPWDVNSEQPLYPEKFTQTTAFSFLGSKATLRKRMMESRLLVECGTGSTVWPS